MGVHLDRAEILLQQSRFELAEKELREELTTDPENPLAHAWLSLCLVELRQYEEAVKESDLAIHIAPDSSYVHYVQARVFFKRYKEYRRTLNDVKQLQKAEAAIAEAIRLAPENPDCFVFLANLHLERAYRREQNLESITVSDFFAGKDPHKDCYLKALEAVDRGLRIDPEHSDCLDTRTVILHKLGRKQQAIATVKAALTSDPENAMALNNLGWLLLDEDENLEALKNFRAALQIAPQLENSRLGVIEAYKRRYLIYRLLSITTKMGRIIGCFPLIIVIVEFITSAFEMNSS